MSRHLIGILRACLSDHVTYDVTSTTPSVLVNHDPKPLGFFA